MPNAVMLFAAGFGTRMGDLTKTRPKPLIEVAGKPLIDHAMTLVREYQADIVVVNAHYKADQIIRHFEGSDVHVTVEMPQILDTGGGLKAALPLLNADPVITMNTDAVWRGPNPLSVLANAWKDDMRALLLCVPKSQVIGHLGEGDFDVLPQGLATWGAGTVYSGVQLIRANCVSNFAETAFSLRKVWEQLERENYLHAVTYPGLWCDVGHPDGVTQAEAMLAGHNV